MLYINHKPAVPLSSKSIGASFECISQRYGFGRILGTVDITYVGFRSLRAGADLTLGELNNLLMSEGEVLYQAELDANMLALLGSNTPISDNAVINPGVFAADILGFDQGDDHK
jgi:hypothetical protein